MLSHARHTIQAFFIRLPKWLAEIAVWLWAGRMGWGAFLLPSALLMIFWSVPICWEQRIRLTGMFLELAGLFTVAWGLSGIRTLFGHPGLLADVRTYFDRFPRWGRDPMIPIQAFGASTLPNMTSFGHGTVFPGPDTPIETRVHHLEQTVARLGGELFEVKRTIDDTDRKQQERLRIEAQQREAGDDQTRKQLEEAVAGGLHLEMIGVCWIALGILLATASNEIASIPLFPTCRR